MISAVLLRWLLDHTKKTWQHVSPQVGSMRMGFCHGKLLVVFSTTLFTFHFSMQTRAATRVALLQQVFSNLRQSSREGFPTEPRRLAQNMDLAELLQTVCSAMSTGLAQACTALFILEQLPDYSPELCMECDESSAGVLGRVGTVAGPQDSRRSAQGHGNVADSARERQRASSLRSAGAANAPSHRGSAAGGARSRRARRAHQPRERGAAGGRFFPRRPPVCRGRDAADHCGWRTARPADVRTCS